MWREIHRDGFETFHDQDGTSELTNPAGHRVAWSGPRPEMDKKDATAGHPEVHTPPYSAVGFLPFKTFRWWCYTDAAIPATPGRRTRGRAWVMVVAHGIDGNQSRPGACGMRVGIAESSTSDPNSSILWSEWWVVRDTLENERVWHELVTPEIIPVGAGVRLWVQCNNDVASAIAAGHWDDEVVEQWIEGTGPPETHTIETFVDGQLVARGEFSTVELR